MRLERKIAIVTGGGTGIGEAIAKVFAREGAKVAVTGRRKDELERVVGAIERNGGQALALPGSVTSEPDVQEGVDPVGGRRRDGRMSDLKSEKRGMMKSRDSLEPRSSSCNPGGPKIRRMSGSTTLPRLHHHRLRRYLP